jgi:hypothetical protein
LESHAALDAFLSPHLSERLHARGFSASAAEWMIGRSIRLDDRLGPLLETADGFALRQRDSALSKSLTESNKLRNRLIHRVNERITSSTARKSVTAVMSLVRLLDAPLFWRAIFGFAGLPRTTFEVMDAPIRSLRVRLGHTMARTPSVALTGPCGPHPTVSDITPESFVLHHRDPLDHPWEYGLALEANP